MNVYVDWGRDRWVEHIGVTTLVLRITDGYFQVDFQDESSITFKSLVAKPYKSFFRLHLETIGILDAATHNHPSLTVEVLMLKDPSQLSRLCKCPLFRPTQATLQKVEKMKAGVGFKEMR